MPPVTSTAMSTAMSNATNFFHACESLQGAIGSHPFMQPGATFEGQCEPVAELETAAQYANWLQTLGTTC